MIFRFKQLNKFKGKRGDIVAYQYKKLRGRIIEVFDSQGEFAKKIGLSETSVSNKMTGKTGFDQTDMVQWCEALNIPIEKAGEYFFA